MIIFVHQGGEIGGAERMLETLGAHLARKHGLEVGHFCPFPSPLAVYLAETSAGEVVVYGKPHRQRQALRVLAGARTLRRFARANPGSVLVANGPRGYLYAALATVGTGRRVIQVIHDPAVDRLSAVASRVHPPTATVFASNRAHDESPRHVQTRRGTRVIQAPIDTDRIDTAIGSGRPPVDPMRLVTVARLQEHKGHDTLLQAFGAVVTEFPQARLVVVGAAAPNTETTKDALEQILAGRAIDLLFIDGDHTYEGVRADFEMYSPLVRAGGLVGFHDTLPHTKAQHCHVDQFWNEIKLVYPHREYTVPGEDGDRGQWGGIGVLEFEALSD